jgi:general secretion pathway protein G
MTATASCHRAPRPRGSAGFTLVEILVVIVVIGILAGLLLPAITGALGRANNAAVSAEITLLANALAAFKDKYGDYPPSRVILRENGSYVVATDSALPDTTRASGDADLWYGDLYQRSAQRIQKFWPRVRLNTASVAYDFNGDGTAVDGSGNPQTHFLDGAECLVFFLGGIRSSSGVGVAGFAKNPSRPFVGDNVDKTLAIPGTSNRDQAFFEFKTDRLVDLDNDGFYEYADPLSSQRGEQRPYAYFSAYGSNGYDPNDVNYTFDGDSTTGAVPIARQFRVSFRPKDDTGTATNLVVSAAPNPYTSSPPVNASTTVPVTFINANTYQIISAGRDRMYGLGGQYDASSSQGRLIFSAGDSVKVGKSSVVPLTTEFRAREADNLSNFSGSTLD